MSLPGASSPRLTIPPAEVPFNSRVGKYQVLRRIACGGMADLYLAYLSGTMGAFRRLVVMKRVLPHFATQPAFVRMFFDEARLSTTLRHPNIVQVLDVGSTNGNFFLTMEYLLGRDLDEVMRASPVGPLPLGHALNVVTGICSALHYVHEKASGHGKPLELVHRDVSPSNVFVTYDGSVKLLDFGLARAGTAVESDGSVWGKPHYMSPEQCRGERLDRRSDVFSLGVILYELTTGVPLFSHRSGADAMREIAFGRLRPPREILPSYPPALEAIVLKALARSRESRFQSARDLLMALTRFVRDSQIDFSPMGLQAHMEELFRDDIEGWPEAREAGLTFAEHLATLAIADREEARAVAMSNALAQADARETRRMSAGEFAAVAPRRNSLAAGPVSAGSPRLESR